MRRPDLLPPFLPADATMFGWIRLLEVSSRRHLRSVFSGLFDLRLAIVIEDE